MLLVVGTIEVNPSNRDRALAIAAAVQIQSRLEEGCLYYNFSTDIEAPQKLTIVECWRSDEAHAIHVGTSHLKVFLDNMKAVGILSLDASKFHVISTEHIPMPEEWTS